jgi:hypothetical protein
MLNLIENCRAQRSHQPYLFLSAPLSLPHQTSTATFLSLSGLYHYHHSTTVLAYGGKDVMSDAMEAQMTSTVVWALGKLFFIRFVFLSSK